MSAVAAFHKRIAGTHGQRIAWTSEQIERIARHYGIDASRAGLPVLPPTQRRAPELVLRDTSADGPTFSFVASTGEVDRMGDTIDPYGWQLSDFKRNPVVLFAHDSGSLPVGRATSVGVQENKLMASIKFASTGLGRAVAGLVSGGFLKAVSVGFAPGNLSLPRIRAEQAESTSRPAISFWKSALCPCRRTQARSSNQSAAATASR